MEVLLLCHLDPFLRSAHPPPCLIKKPWVRRHSYNFLDQDSKTANALTEPDYHYQVEI